MHDRWKDREDREYLRTGILGSTIANFAGKSLRGRSLKPMDFVPGYKAESEGMTGEQMYRHMKMALGYRIKPANA